MNRRAFVQSSLAASLLAAFPCRAAPAAAPWRAFEVVTRVEVLDPFGAARAWVPLALQEDTDWQRTLGHGWSGNAARARIVQDRRYGVRMLYAEWPEHEMAPVIEVSAQVLTRDRAVDLSRPDMRLADLGAGEREFYTAPTEMIPTDGIVRRRALEITRGAATDLDRARAIYDWVVENTHRDPQTRGCGWGDVKSMLESGNLGGKCGDLNALFVGLARAAGVPARDVYGLRIAPSRLGYRSLGVATPNVTRAQHCRAEFFARGFGWVPVDPADVRKVMLEEPPGGLPATDARVESARKRLFGAWEMNWLAYNMGHDVKLPGSSGPRLPYLMYINAEAAGEMRDQLEPETLRYAISARERHA